jgi:hypothetical protein
MLVHLRRRKSGPPQRGAEASDRARDLARCVDRDRRKALLVQIRPARSMICRRCLHRSTQNQKSPVYYGLPRHRGQTISAGLTRLPDGQRPFHPALRGALGPSSRSRTPPAAARREPWTCRPRRPSRPSRRRPALDRDVVGDRGRVRHLDRHPPGTGLERPPIEPELPARIGPQPQRARAALARGWPPGGLPLLFLLLERAR